MLLKKIFYSSLWGKRLCPFPFNRLEISNQNDFIPCCYDWVKYDSLPTNTNSQVWNSEQAQLIRRSMHDGSMKYCDQSKCNAITFSFLQLVFFSFFAKFSKKFPYHTLSFKVLLSILLKKEVLTEKPSHLNYSSDLSCNLKCPSCRSNYISNDPKINLEKNTGLFKDIALEAETILFSGGEFFFSKRNLNILQSIKQSEYPNLKTITVMTNGLLFNKKLWDGLGEGKLFIKRILVSIDAGNESHYRITRGGNFKHLLENLEFIKTLKESNELDFFSIQFVPRKDNYESMEEFVLLGEKLNVDRVLFQTFCQWSESSLEFVEQAIHLKTHPNYHDFEKIAQKVKHKSIVTWNIEVST
ncbi:MAG: radical SAM protein [Bacteriovorax sp.]|nr:radical SAM protein [Bacteriovorax sp.]